MTASIATLPIITFCLGCCVGMTYTYIVYRVVERKYRKKDAHQGPSPKKLIYGRQQTLDKYVEQHKAKGWRVVRTKTVRWANGKKSYIAELEKP